MRFRSPLNEGYGFKGIDSTGGSMILPVKFLFAPLGDMDAVNKQYVDDAANNMTTTNIVGIFQSERLPAFTGTDISSAGGGVFTLKTSGVTPGAYGKVSVNSKGLVTSGGALIASDIPTLSWNKLTNTPTTLAGYGITGVVSVNDSVMTGPLSITPAPTSPLHLANKQYVDSKVGNSAESAFSTGDIVYKSYTGTVTGYLRCNGGLISKINYADLYSVVGDIYNYPGVKIGGGAPWKNQNGFNPSSQLDITDWSSRTVLTSFMSEPEIVITNNKLLLIGGSDNTLNGISTVRICNIAADGTIGSSSSTYSLPVGLTGHLALVINNYIYVFGGATAYDNNVYKYVVSDAVYRTTISATGTIGSWSLVNQLPSLLYASGGDEHTTSGFLTKNRVYIYRNNETYYADFNSNGEIGSWSRLNGEVFTYGGRFFITLNRVYTIAPSGIWYALFLKDGSIGTWTLSGPLTNYYSLYSNSITVNERVFLIGHSSHDVESANCYSAPVLLDGSIGEFTAISSVPIGLYILKVAVTRDWVYSFSQQGGVSVIRAPFQGVTNDLTGIHNLTYSNADPDKFYLPDLTSSDKKGSYSYIKI